MIRSLPEVLAPDEWENDTGPKGWYAISTEEAGGIVAYAETEALAGAICGMLVNDPSLRK